MLCVGLAEAVDGVAMNYLDFLYCCMYRWSERVNGKDYPNIYSASIMMTFILMLIVGAALSAAVSFIGVDLSSMPYGRAILVLSLVISFLAIHAYFYRRGEWPQRLRAFDGSASRFRTMPGVVVATSLFIALLSLFFTWILLI